MSEQALGVIRTRRVIRDMSDKPVEREQLERILDAGRWAPSGGNQRLHRFVVIQDPLTLRLIRLFAPGMFQRSPLLILICVDWDQVRFHRLPAHNRSIYIDIGTAAENMMLAAHALGLGSGPVTSFSQAAIGVILNLPARLTPEMFICIGHPARKEQPAMRPRKKITWRDLTDWERYP